MMLTSHPSPSTGWGRLWRSQVAVCIEIAVDVVLYHLSAHYPPGIYYIVERQKGSLYNRARSAAVDFYKTLRFYYTNHSEWFALYRADGLIDDNTFIDKVSRGSFRLHPGQVSEGCITLPHRSDFELIRSALLRTEKIVIPGTKLFSYGTIEVIANGNTCP